jgi:hypothetical protein
MVVLGIIIGLSINTNERDSQIFLTTGAIIVIVSKFGMESILISILGKGVSGTIYSIFFYFNYIIYPCNNNSSNKNSIEINRSLKVKTLIKIILFN